MLLEIIQHSTGLIFFSLVYSLKWLSSDVHLPIHPDFTEGILKYDCLCHEFSKDYKNKYTRMNCWTNVADKFDMIRFFLFSAITAIIRKPVDR